MTEREKNRFARNLLKEYIRAYMDMIKDGAKEVRLEAVLLTLKDLYEILSKGIK